MTGWHYLSQEKRNIEEGDDTLFPLNRLKYELRNDFVVALQLCISVKNASCGSTLTITTFAPFFFPTRTIKRQNTSTHGSLFRFGKKKPKKTERCALYLHFPLMKSDKLRDPINVPKQNKVNVSISRPNAITSQRLLTALVMADRNCRNHFGASRSWRNNGTIKILKRHVDDRSNGESDGGDGVGPHDDRWRKTSRVDSFSKRPPFSRTLSRQKAGKFNCKHR